MTMLDFVSLAVLIAARANQMLETMNAKNAEKTKFSAQKNSS